MEAYKDVVRKRQAKEAETLASLTGWSIGDIRRKMGPDGVNVPDPKPWYRRIWKN
jgi:hypothetical protein